MLAHKREEEKGATRFEGCLKDEAGAPALEQ